MYSSDPITNGQFSTDVAALAACVNAGSGACSGVAFNPGLAASIRWSARATGGIVFSMSGVTWHPFAGCHRQLYEVNVDESDPAYQATLPSPDWWQVAYGMWLAEHPEKTPSPAYVAWQQQQPGGRQLQLAEQYERSPDLDDHWEFGNSAKRERAVRKRAAREPLWSIRGLRSPDDRV